MFWLENTTNGLRSFAKNKKTDLAVIIVILFVALTHYKAWAIIWWEKQFWVLTEFLRLNVPNSSNRTMSDLLNRTFPRWRKNIRTLKLLTAPFVIMPTHLEKENVITNTYSWDPSIISLIKLFTTSKYRISIVIGYAHAHFTHAPRCLAMIYALSFAGVTNFFVRLNSSSCSLKKKAECGIRTPDLPHDVEI